MTANPCSELGISLPWLPFKPIRILNRLGHPDGVSLAITLHLDLTKARTLKDNDSYACLELIFIFPIYQGLRPHPPLRLPRQPKARRPAATVLRRSPRHSTEKPIGNIDRSYSPPTVVLSQVRRTDGRRRTIHSRTTPTPFSTAPGHGCMKSLAHTPHCRRASERLAEVCPRDTQTSSPCPRPGSLRPSTRLCAGVPPATPTALTTPPTSTNLPCSIQFA